MKIYVFCGGPSSEYDVSLSSAQEIVSHIDKEKHPDIAIFHIARDSTVSIVPVETAHFNIDDYKLNDWDPETFIELSETTYQNIEDSLVEFQKNPNSLAFISAMHGEFGEDGTLQKLLQNNNITYTGSNSACSELVIDKDATNTKISSIPELHIPKTEVVSANTLSNWSMFPAIVKPNNLGSSVGLTIIERVDDISLDLHEGYIIQEYIHGIELSCGALEKPNGGFFDVPAIEIIPSESTLFDYEAKYIEGKSQEITPPEHISDDLHITLKKLAQDIHLHLGCRSYSRSDFILRDTDIYFLETNTLPGFTSTSLFPKEVQAIGISFSELIDIIIQESI